MRSCVCVCVLQRVERPRETVVCYQRKQTLEKGRELTQRSYEYAQDSSEDLSQAAAESEF